MSYPLSNQADKLDLLATLSENSTGGLGWELFIDDKIKSQIYKNVDTISLTGKSSNPITIKVLLKSIYGYSYSVVISMPLEYSTMSIALKNFIPDSALLLPRPYPGFQALKFKPANERKLVINEIEKIQIEYLKKPLDLKEPLEVRISKIDLQ